ncbi:MAG TPA: PadR family transcriptional regulator [Pseudonocardia sp.]|jgi:DNA-binding PadR family transcriptional regulator
MSELEPRNFLQPCLLLLLCENPDHGYELAARLRPMHDGDGDAGGIYRALRGLERQGLVRSEWHTSRTGPARRTYHVTGEGVTALESQVNGLKKTHAALHVFLDRYDRLPLAVIPTQVRADHERADHERADHERADHERADHERADHERAEPRQGSLGS